MPYQYKIIKEITDKSEYIYDLEKELHRKYKKFKYEPKIYFGGITECFNINLPINEIK